MQKHRLISATVGGLLVVLLAITIVALGTTQPQAQPEGRRDQQAGLRQIQPPDVRGGREFGPGQRAVGGPGGMRMFAGARGGVALTAYGDYVYVLRGNTLYQFAADGLKLVNTVTLEEERPRGQQDGPRREPAGRRPIRERPQLKEQK